jgi:cytochrome c biogenesis protein CcdA
VIDSLIAQLSEGTVLAPLLAFAVGALLSLSPVALPSTSVVVSALVPAGLGPDGHRVPLPLLRTAPSVAAFVLGMDGLLGLVGYLFVEVTEAFTRASVALHLGAAALLAILGLRLLLRRASLCHRAGALPPSPGKALVFGAFFAVGGCPACGPIVISLGAASALVAGPVYALVVLSAFLVGRTGVLLATAGLGARLLPATGPAAFRRLDLIVGALFLVAAGYYLFRVLNGDVSTKLPGEPGSGLLP